MTRQEQIKSLLGSGLFNIRKVEAQAGIRKYKLYEYIKDSVKLSALEEQRVLGILRSANKLQK